MAFLKLFTVKLFCKPTQIPTKHVAGTDRTYQRSDLGEHGTAFKVVPMYNERRGNFKGCWYRNGTKTIPIIPQPILPNIEEFEVMLTRTVHIIVEMVTTGNQS